MLNPSRSTALILFALHVFVACLTTPTTIAATSSSTDNDTAAGKAAHPLDPTLIVGNDACIKCHASEIKVWQKTAHAKTFDELHRRPEAKKIAANLGVASIKNDGRCVACHYTPKSQSSGSHLAIAGVSCESCHGAAKKWLDIHNNYGGEGVTRLTESPAHRKQRIARSVAAGMRNPHNVYLVAQSCLRCHTTADEQLVNEGGHSVGSLEFEFVSWSQGTLRHNFVRTDGKSNDVSSPERIRVMFVAGIVAELEASLRATALATEKSTYGVNAAKRAARAGARIKSVAEKVNSPLLTGIVGQFESVTLKLNNVAELTAAADKIADLGYQFAESTDGEELSDLDQYIPKGDRFK